MLVLVAMGTAWWREEAQPWRSYQRDAYRLQATNARVALRLAGSAAERLAAQTQLDRAEHAAVEVIAVVPSQTGKPELCLTCHLGIEEISPSHPVEAFGCVVCHGGDPLALDKGMAHAGMRGGRNPSRLDVAAQSCGQTNCHGGFLEAGPGNRNMVDRVTRSMQATYASGIALVRYAFGAQPRLEPLYGLKSVVAARPAVPPALARLVELPPAGPDGNAVDARFRTSCLEGGCHVWTPARRADYFHRGEGCAACHVQYGVDGKYRGGDATLASTEASRGAQHRLSTAIPFSTCNACHNRGNYDLATLSYHPRDDLKPATLGTLTASERRLREYYQPIGQFTLCEWELDCIDCHTANQAMGDGDIYGRMKDSQSTQCLTCHGTLAAKAPVAPVVDPDDAAVRQARVSGKYKVDVGDWLVVTSSGDKLPNVKRVGDRYVLTTKVGGQEYTVPQVMGSACQENVEQQESAACHACHAVAR